MDYTVTIFDVENGLGRVATLQGADGPNNGMYGIAFSPDGNRVATGILDNAIKIWDLDNPSDPLRSLQTLKGHEVRPPTPGAACLGYFANEEFAGLCS